MRIHFHIQLGKDLSQQDLNTINEARIREFQSSSRIDPRPDNEHWEKEFFLLKGEGDRLLAFARLHHTEVEFNRQKYPVLGMATLVAIEKGRGFGKSLVTFMKYFIENTGITGIGFCNPNLTAYYQNIGFGIIRNGTQNTLYKDSQGTLHHDKWGGGDLIYVEGKDDLITNMLTNPNQNLFILRPHW